MLPARRSQAALQQRTSASSSSGGGSAGGSSGGSLQQTLSGVYAAMHRGLSGAGGALSRTVSRLSSLGSGYQLLEDEAAQDQAVLQHGEGGAPAVSQQQASRLSGARAGLASAAGASARSSGAGVVDAAGGPLLPPDGAGWGLPLPGLARIRTTRLAHSSAGGGDQGGGSSAPPLLSQPPSVAGGGPAVLAQNPSAYRTRLDYAAELRASSDPLLQPHELRRLQGSWQAVSEPGQQRSGQSGVRGAAGLLAGSFTPLAGMDATNR